MLFNNPLTATSGMILDNVDNNRWEVPIPQKEKKGDLTLLHKCTAMVPLECKEALYTSTSKTIKRLTPYIENHKVK